MRRSWLQIGCPMHKYISYVSIMVYLDKQQPNVEEYRQFMSKSWQRVKHTLQQKPNEKTLKKLRIEMIPQTSEKIKIGRLVRVKQHRATGLITVYQVIISIFQLEIRMLNIKSNSQLFQNRYTLLGCGGFSQIYKQYKDDINIAMKATHRRYMRDFSQQDVNFQIQNTICQVAIAKILSVYGVAPPSLEMSIDIVKYEDTIVHFMKELRPIQPIVKNIDMQRFSETLREKLLLMHCLGIVHRDIKPHNIMLYQHQYYFIDFGLSHYVREGMNEKTYTFAGGTINYMSQQMRDMIAGQYKPVNLYYNDLVGFKNTIKHAKHFRDRVGFTRPRHIVQKQVCLSELDITMSSSAQTQQIYVTKKMRLFKCVDLLGKIVFKQGCNLRQIEKDSDIWMYAPWLLIKSNTSVLETLTCLQYFYQCYAKICTGHKAHNQLSEEITAEQHSGNVKQKVAAIRQTLSKDIQKQIRQLKCIRKDQFAPGCQKVEQNSRSLGAKSYSSEMASSIRSFKDSIELSTSQQSLQNIMLRVAECIDMESCLQKAIRQLGPDHHYLIQIYGHMRRHSQRARLLKMYEPEPKTQLLYSYCRLPLTKHNICRIRNRLTQMDKYPEVYKIYLEAQLLLSTLPQERQKCLCQLTDYIIYRCIPGCQKFSSQSIQEMVRNYGKKLLRLVYSKEATLRKIASRIEINFETRSRLIENIQEPK